LSETSVCPTGPGIAPVNQIFDFLAVKAGSEFKVVFELRAPWRPDEPGDTEIFDVTIEAPKQSAADDIESAMQGRAFVPASAVNVGAQAAGSAAPISQAASVIYAAPMSQAASVIYAAPMSQAASVASRRPLKSSSCTPRR